MTKTLMPMSMSVRFYRRLVATRHLVREPIGSGVPRSGARWPDDLVGRRWQRRRNCYACAGMSHGGLRWGALAGWGPSLWEVVSILRERRPRATVILASAFVGVASLICTGFAVVAARGVLVSNSFIVLKVGGLILGPGVPLLLAAFGYRGVKRALTGWPNAKATLLVRLTLLMCSVILVGLLGMLGPEPFMALLFALVGFTWLSDVLFRPWLSKLLLRLPSVSWPSHPALAIGGAVGVGSIMLPAVVDHGQTSLLQVFGVLLRFALIALFLSGLLDIFFVSPALRLLRRFWERRRVAGATAVVTIAGAIGALGLSSFMGGLHLVLVPLFIVLAGIWPTVLIARQVERTKACSLAVGLDVLLALVLGGDGFLLLNQRYLTATLSAAFLLPAAVWSGFLGWRWMTVSSRLWVRAASDIVLSVTLGTTVVAVLAWVASLANLSIDQVRFVKDMLGRLSAATDVPGWAWVVTYAVLAVLGAVLAVRATEQPSAVRRWQSLRLVPGIGAGERVVSAVHMTLLVTTLVGVAAPRVAAVPLQAHVRAQYLLATQDELVAIAERAAYEAIQSTFAQPSPAPARLAPLAAMLETVERVAGPDPGDERGVARRLGAVQATAISPAASKPGLAGSETASAVGDLPDPIRDAADARSDLDRLERREEEAKEAQETLRQSAELAASAVASALALPALPNATQLVQEYLAGLVEGSRLAEVFYKWAKSRWFHEAPAAEPDAGVDAVVPDPPHLRGAALADLGAEAHVDLDPVGMLELVRQEVAWLDISPLDGAVLIVFQAHVMHQQWLCQACDAHPRIAGLHPRGSDEEGSSGSVERPPVEERHPIIRP
jgi:hypothetical protein